MFITNRNDLLYDTKNFDKYNNIYCVLLNIKKIKEREKKLGDNKLHHTYVNEQLNLFFLFEKFSSTTGERKIVFGHYYNNRNTFLYKDVKNSKVISYNIKQCRNKELLYRNDKLICSNTYENLKKQIDYIDLTETKKIKEDHIYPFIITYNKNSNNLSINSNGIVLVSFNNGCLSINNK